MIKSFIDTEPSDRRPVMCDIDKCDGSVVDIVNIGGVNVGLCKKCGDLLLGKCRLARNSKSLWEELLR